MSEPTLPPPPGGRVTLGLTAISVVIAATLSLALPTLRQGRLLEAARDVCLERTAEATTWLERESVVGASLAEEELDARAQAASLLSTEAASTVEPLLAALGERVGMKLETSRLGTRREAAPLRSAPATAVFVGPRTALPELLDGLYGQERAIRLVALDVELPRFSEPTIRTTLRWEYAVGGPIALVADDPTTRWSPPVVASQASALAFGGWNRARWEALDDAASALRALGPRLRALAQLDATRVALQEQRAALGRWREAQVAEANAIQRRLPELLRRLDLSADGSASLRPGAGGRLVVGDVPGP